jgi:hypothetical protein
LRVTEWSVTIGSIRPEAVRSRVQFIQGTAL